MIKIRYIAHGGEAYEVCAKAGTSAMEVAVMSGVPGIEAECGGACACGTCHVYVDPGFFDLVGAPPESESAMIEFVPEPRPTSRLSCQITITEALDGLVLHLPESQR
jgi:2Fe-2S ferredoxin